MHGMRGHCGGGEVQGGTPHLGPRNGYKERRTLAWCGGG